MSSDERSVSVGHQPSFAAGSYLEPRERLALLERDEQLERFVIDRLNEGWTPEQIAGWLKAGNEPRLTSPCRSGSAQRPFIALFIMSGRRSRSSGGSCPAARAAAP
jgi:hypothetical protein